MVSSADGIEHYQFRVGEEVFLDANVWFFVYGPQKPGDAKVALYSRALQRILSANSRISIDVLVVSEFINTYSRLKWNVFKRHNPARSNEKFKEFRKSADFKPIAQEIADSVKRVLSHCTKVESEFAAMSVDDIVDEFARGESDFNDQVIVELCRRKRLKLLTDDGDFKGCGVPLITGNRRLLS